MRSTILPLASAVVLATLAAACSMSSGGDDAASGDQASTAGDLQTAKDVVSILGGTTGKCKTCHGVTESTVKKWGAALSDTQAKCFADTTMAPMAVIDCLRSTPGVATSSFNPHRLGLYAAGIPGQQFKDAFAKAYPADQGKSEYTKFAAAASMPKDGNNLTDAEFAKVKTWVLAGMPQIDGAFNVTPPPGPASSCTPGSSQALLDHINSMKTTGWGAKLADQTTPMFGCNDATDPTKCLTGQPDATATYGAPSVAQTLRQLYTQRLQSHYWVRSSADGRYTGFGMNSSAQVIDLSNPGTPIAVDADYDPYFLPSNDGFAFAGSQAGGDIVMCKQSLLGDVTHSASPEVKLTESKCTSLSSNVYMSIGTSLDGLRYWMTYGTHANDDGGNDITQQIGADFGTTAVTTLTPMVNNGLSYKAGTPTTMKLPNEGDMMLSASTQLASTRFGDSTHSFGYNIRSIQPTVSAAGGATGVTTPVVGTVCMPGQKANFSFDERYLVTHQYVDTTQADQAGLPAGSSNIMMADLQTGKTVRITTVKAGQFALYPHFRADGWLYFLVRDMNTSKEFILASDAALQMSAATP